MLGEDAYTLTCNINVADDPSFSIIYQWTKNTGNVTEPFETNSRNLSFSPLRLSDAGQYTCQATVTSPHINGNITVMDSQDIRLQSELDINSWNYIMTDVSISLPTVPPTFYAILYSNARNSIAPVGSNVTLTCTVRLQSGPEIDVPLTVYLVIYEFDLRDGNPLPTTTPSVSGSTYTSVATISSFRREQSGNYHCLATTSPTSPNTFLSSSVTSSNLHRITTGEMPQ